MKFPLFCETCDMITGHESDSLLKGHCRVCGQICNTPVLKWVTLISGVVIVLGGIFYCVVVYIL